MTNEERDIQRKLRVLQHAEKIGNARKACRYFGIGKQGQSHHNLSPAILIEVNPVVEIGFGRRNGGLTNRSYERTRT